MFKKCFLHKLLRSLDSALEASPSHTDKRNREPWGACPGTRTAPHLPSQLLVPPCRGRPPLRPAPAATPAGQHAVIRVLLAGPGNEGVSGASHNYSLVGRRRAPPLSHITKSAAGLPPARSLFMGLVKGRDREASSGWGLRSWEELSTESPGLYCFEIMLLPHPYPTHANIPIQGRGQTCNDTIRGIHVALS